MEDKTCHNRLSHRSHVWPDTTSPVTVQIFYCSGVVVTDEKVCGRADNHPPHYWNTTYALYHCTYRAPDTVAGYEDQYCGNPEEHTIHNWTDAPETEKFSKEFICLGSFFEVQNLPQYAVEAFMEAWEAERKKIGRGISEPGSKTRAGLSAALKTLYKKRDLEF